MDNEKNLYNAPKGAAILPGVLIMINHYWGRGATIDSAWRSLQKEKGGSVTKLKREPHKIYMVFHFIVEGDEDATVRTYVGDLGGLCYHQDYPPYLLHNNN